MRFPDDMGISVPELNTLLDEGEIPVFTLPLSEWCPPTDPEGLGLDAEEKTRCKRFGREEDRLAFLAGRWMIRSLLSSLLREDNVALRIDARGKPFCGHPASPFFNLSHGGGWAALALSACGPVGVDLEDVTRRVSTEAVARRCFASREYDVFLQEGREGFFRVWTRKEARVKAEGTGISIPLKQVDTVEEERRGEWSYHPFRPAGPVIGCAACPGAVSRFRVFSPYPG